MKCVEDDDDDDDDDDVAVVPVCESGDGSGALADAVSGGCEEAGG